jgi:hypothetical protein
MEPISSPSRHQSVIDVDRLSSSDYDQLIKAVRLQIADTINNALNLQCLSSFIDILLFTESIIYLIATSAQSWLRSDSYVVAISFFSISVFLACLSMITKWLQSRLKRDVIAYRNILLELIAIYGKDALEEVERLRLALPSKVLALGFFRGITTQVSR